MYNQSNTNFPGSNIPNSTMPNSTTGFPGGQPGLSQPTSILNAPQGEVGGLLGPGIPQNQGMINPLRSGTTTGTGVGTGTHGVLGNKVRGTIIFRPIEARFNKDKDIIGKMDPYCKFKIGMHSAKSSVATGEGTTPVWNETVPVKYKGQSYAKLKLKDKDRLKPDSRLGSVKINLDQIVNGGPTTQWYSLEKMGGRISGEIQVEIAFQPTGTTHTGTGITNTGTTHTGVGTGYPITDTTNTGTTYPGTTGVGYTKPEVVYTSTTYTTVGQPGTTSVGITNPESYTGTTYTGVGQTGTSNVGFTNPDVRHTGTTNTSTGFPGVSQTGTTGTTFSGTGPSVNHTTY